jgi:hypothetical protein
MPFEPGTRQQGSRQRIVDGYAANETPSCQKLSSEDQEPHDDTYEKKNSKVRSRVKGEWSCKQNSLSLAERRASLQALRVRIEKCFTDANLATDHFLHCKIREALPTGGWVSCRVLSQYKSLESLVDNPRRAIHALHASHLETKLSPAQTSTVHLSCDHIFVRRRQPLPPLLRKECQHPDQILPADVRGMVLEDRFGTVNRLVDQRRVQVRLGLKEVGDSSTVFRERGPSTEEGPVLAIGFERVIYGDGGPYIEVRDDHICWKAWPHFFSKRAYHSYYDEYYTETSHRKWCERWELWIPNTRGLLMLYAQVHTVADRPWAPGASSLNPHAERAGGYADYRPGYFYFTADENLITVERGISDSDTGHAGSNTASGDSASIHDSSDSDTTTPHALSSVTGHAGSNAASGDSASIHDSSDSDTTTTITL